MTPYWIALLLVSFGAALLLHRLACRLSLEADRVSRFVAAGGIAGAGLLWATSARYGIASVETVAAALVYGFLCELYIFLFTMTISSISSNLLVRLSSQDMRVEEIAHRYDSRQMVRQRLERLAATGFVSRAGSGLVLTPKGAGFVRTFEALRRFFRQS